MTNRPMPNRRAQRWRAEQKKILDERDAECVRLYQGGWSIWDVAAFMDVAHTSVSQMLRRAKIKRRNG